MRAGGDLRAGQFGVVDLFICTPHWERNALLVSHTPRAGKTRRQRRAHRRNQTNTNRRLICTDCDAVDTGEPPTVRHRDACPVGRGIDDAMASDREWFAARPDSAVRERALTWAEREQQVALGAPREQLDGARVTVRNIASGVRVRVIVAAGRRTR